MNLKFENEFKIRTMNSKGVALAWLVIAEKPQHLF